MRMRIHMLVLALAATVVSPTAAEAQGRSPLETPDAVKKVRVHVDGAVALSKLESEGFDFSGGLVRVPDGLEVDAIVTDQQELDLVARGAEIVEPGQEFKWKTVKRASFAAQAADAAQAAEPTVRIVRADWFTTKGQGFLYVEARTTQGAQTDPTVGMTLENDQGPGTEFISAAHDEPVRGLRRLHVPPQPVQARQAPGQDPRVRRARAASRRAGVRLAPGRDADDDDARATSTTSSTTTRRRSRSTAASSRSRSSTRRSPRSSRSRTRPTATSARRRRRSAGPASPRSSSARRRGATRAATTSRSSSSTAPAPICR